MTPFAQLEKSAWAVPQPVVDTIDRTVVTPISRGVTAVGNALKPYLPQPTPQPTTVVPEKRAGINLAQIGSMASRAWKGFKGGGADMVSAASGRGMKPMSEVGQELGRAGQAGNLAGLSLAGGSILYGGDKMMDGMLNKSPDKPNSGMRFDARPRDFVGQVKSMHNGPGHREIPRDMLQPAQRSILNGIKANPLVDAAVPDLASLPSGFQQNKLLQLLRGPQ